MLKCMYCGEEHDLNGHPDTGNCVKCGGALVEGGEDGDDAVKVALEVLGTIMGISKANPEQLKPTRTKGKVLS